MKCLECQRLMRPYLLKELSDKELSQFLDHIEHCQNCYEELELNLAVTSSLDEKSVLRDNNIYDFEAKLKRDIAAGRRHLRFVHSYGFMRRLLVILAEVVMIITVVTAVELNMFKDHSQTHLYKIMHHGQTTVEILPEMDSDGVSEAISEAVSEAVAEVGAEYESESETQITEAATETATENVSEDMSEAVPENMSETVAEAVTEDLSETMTEALSEN